MFIFILGGKSEETYMKWP